MVQRLVRDTATDPLRRGVFSCVPEPVAAIDEYVAHHDGHPRAVHLDKKRSRHLAVGHSRELALKFQTD